MKTRVEQIREWYEEEVNQIRIEPTIDWKDDAIRDLLAEVERLSEQIDETARRSAATPKQGSPAMSEAETDGLLRLAEHLRDEARLHLFALSQGRHSASFVDEGVAKLRVEQSNLLRKALIHLGCRGTGPEWEIVGYKVEEKK